MQAVMKNQSELIINLIDEVYSLKTKLRQKKSTMERILKFLGLYHDDDDWESNQ